MTEMILLDPVRVLVGPDQPLQDHGAALLRGVASRHSANLPVKQRVQRDSPQAMPGISSWLHASLMLIPLYQSHSRARAKPSRALCDLPQQAVMARSLCCLMTQAAGANCLIDFKGFSWPAVMWLCISGPASVREGMANN